MLLNLLMSIISSEAIKTLIGIGVKKLLEHQTDGITKDLAVTMIDGIAKSQANPTTEDVFSSALNQLQGA